MNKEYKTFRDHIFIGLSMLINYLVAKCILAFHYDKKKFMSSKWLVGGKYGRFTAPGWKWIVDDYYGCKRHRINKDVNWPVSHRIVIVSPENIVFHPDDINNFQGFGNYFQALGKIIIGKGTYIAPNVGIVTSNHSLENLDVHDDPLPVEIGNKCWIGMNSMILPGVKLGVHTIVGAGSVVTHSFPEGNCIIAGNPAKKIRSLQ